MANFPLRRPGGIAYALKAILPSAWANFLDEDHVKAPNFDEGSTHAPSGDINVNAGGGGKLNVGIQHVATGRVDIENGLKLVNSLGFIRRRRGGLSASTDGSFQPASACTFEIPAVLTADRAYTMLAAPVEGASSIDGIRVCFVRHHRVSGSSVNAFKADLIIPGPSPFARFSVSAEAYLVVESWNNTWQPIEWSSNMVFL